MKKIILSAIFFLSFLYMNAQISTPDVLASGGGFYTGSNFTNSFTIGQGSLPETFTGGTFILTQGFQQPYDFPTGISSSDNSQNVSTYPNPNNGRFDLEYDLNTDATVHVEVFDIVGQTIYSENSERTSGHQVQPIDLSLQPNGIYFIRCTIDTNGHINTLTQKITISR
ncbi:MAG TPA: T9SS type A sorting domain-containing protein [Bacteroidia bacterium]|jgi:hypothetical protein|nr:T9SS type A sorting domain-containing protein [Bacteroidia bacterium]